MFCKSDNLGSIATSKPKLQLKQNPKTRRTFVLLKQISTTPCWDLHSVVLGCETDLRIVGLLNLLLVDADLLLMLRPQVAQGFGQLALKVLLAPAVDLHHAGLTAPLGLAQFLHARIDVEDVNWVMGDGMQDWTKCKVSPDYRRCNQNLSTVATQWPRNSLVSKSTGLKHNNKKRIFNIFKFKSYQSTKLFFSRPTAEFFCELLSISMASRCKLSLSIKKKQLSKRSRNGCIRQAVLYETCKSNWQVVQKGIDILQGV